MSSKKYWFCLGGENNDGDSYEKKKKKGEDNPCFQHEESLGNQQQREEASFVSANRPFGRKEFYENRTDAIMDSARWMEEMGLARHYESERSNRDMINRQEIMSEFCEDRERKKGSLVIPTHTHTHLS